MKINEMDCKCDFCNNKAVVDAKTLLGSWAYMCQTHYRRYGSRVKGLFTPISKDFKEI